MTPLPRCVVGEGVGLGDPLGEGDVLGEGEPVGVAEGVGEPVGVAVGLGVGDDTGDAGPIVPVNVGMGKDAIGYFAAATSM